MLSKTYNTKALCITLGIPRSSYYAFNSPKVPKRAVENKIIKEHISRIFIDNKGLYGAPKIYEIIKTQQLIIENPPSLKRVQRLMKNLGLFARTIKKFRPKKSKSCDLELANNLNGDFKTSKINTKWVADITYIHTIKDGWCYLASVMDLCSH